MLLGKEHPTYDKIDSTSLYGSFAAITVGSDPASPSIKYKGEDPNEDALVLYDDARYCVQAVADAHFGLASSHSLITFLYEALLSSIPKTQEELAQLYEKFIFKEATHSETTLLIAIWDRKEKQGFGVSVGDSTLLLVHEDGIEQCNPKNRRYIDPQKPFFKPEEFFYFSFPNNALLLAFTDGVDECNYRNPEKSINHEDFHKLFKQYGGYPKEYGSALITLALKGVRGHKGGQDNIALIVSKT